MSSDRVPPSDPAPTTTPPTLLLMNAAGDLPTLALRPREASKALGLGARKLWELTRDKKIPHFRVGTAILYPVDALKTWLATQTQGGEQA
jgi:excisionase family DNA binding protein